MKKHTIILGSVALTGLVLAFGLGRMLAPGESNGDGDPQAVHADDEAEATTWTCSMHPQVRQPNPGQCPICGMDLIPLKNDDDGGGATDLPQLRLSERAMALMEIQVAPVRRQEAHAELRLPGRAAVDETRLALVAAWFSGRVDRLYVDYTGAQVQAGEPLLEMYSPQLYGAQQEFLQSLQPLGSGSGATGDSAILQASREKLRLLGLSDRQIENLQKEGKPATQLEYVSPITGTVMERLITAGQYVETGTPLYSVADLSQLWVELEAYESELKYLRTGQQVNVETSAFPGELFSGPIVYIDPEVDAEQRTTRLRIDLSNTDGKLKPGMLVTGKVQVSARDIMDGDADPVVIPATAPLLTGKRAVVYVRLPDTDRPTFEAREVVLGSKLGDVYPVISGVAEGELVVTNGQFKIDSELQIRGRPSMMAPAVDSSATVLVTGGRDPLAPPAKLDISTDVDAAFSKELVPLVEGYIAISEGLAADNAEAAASGVHRIQERLHEIGQHRLSGAAHVAWINHYEQLKDVADVMVAEEDIEGMRGQLQALTHAIESIYVNFGGGQLPPVKRAYCPMVNGDKIGTWLQRGDRIENPYLGIAMLGCGEFIGPLGNGSEGE